MNAPVEIAHRSESGDDRLRASVQDGLDQTDPPEIAFIASAPGIAHAAATRAERDQGVAKTKSEKLGDQDAAIGRRRSRVQETRAAASAGSITACVAK